MGIPKNIPGKSLIVVLISTLPNSATPPHTHSGASVTGLVIRGQSLNQYGGGEVKVYGPEETFHELPTCHHDRAENPSKAEEGALYAVPFLMTGCWKMEGTRHC